MNTLLKSFYCSFSDDDIEILIAYLKRKSTPTGKNTISVVMDILHNCNLNCRGCGTNAITTKCDSMVESAPSIEEIEIACKKLKSFAQKHNMNVFVNIGGGEPFLRKDIEEIIDLLFFYFGYEGIGIDTNGTSIGAYKRIKLILPKLSYLGISLNGLHDYHNWWANVKGFDAYNRTVDLIKQLCDDGIHLDRIEVTSVATKRNTSELPILFQKLSEIGVKHYSVHRAIPVGRMKYHNDLILDAKEYVELLIALIKQSNLLNADFHFHHSIENIHKAILLGETTYDNGSFNDKNMQSSIGITPEGDLVFDAWCMVDQWRDLSCGNIFYDGKNIDEMIENNNTGFYDINFASIASNRCNGCKIQCSGGSRVVATANHLIVDQTSNLNDAFFSIDPACPIYYLNK